jgi:RHS repeat-associated protein
VIIGPLEILIIVLAAGALLLWLVKRVDGSGNWVHVIGPWAEWSNSTAINYYHFDGKRFAIRTGSGLIYLHADHLGSPSVATNTSGTQTGSQRYKPYGTQFLMSGALTTLYQFTESHNDWEMKIYDYGARFYSPLFGRFLQADTIVPGASPQALNRYSYVFNNPLTMVDPSGHDPLDANWEEQFRRRNNGWSPSDADRQNRLFSLLFPGSGAGGAWTDSDWAAFFADRWRYLHGERFWRSGDTRGSGTTWTGGADTFASRLTDLSAHYKPGEEDQFMGAIGLLWAEIPYTGNRFERLGEMVRRDVSEVFGRGREQNHLVETFNGARFDPSLVEPGVGNDPTHHYVMHLWMGYHFSAFDSTLATVVRDGEVQIAGRWWFPPGARSNADMWLGIEGANVGQRFMTGEIGISTLGDWTWQSLRPR